MRYFPILSAILALLAIPVSGQESEVPKAEIFGGYQFTHIEANLNTNGWTASLTGNATPYLGVTADFSGVYKSVSGANLSGYSYTFGPTVSLNHHGVVNPFVHALFGGAHLGASVSGLGSAGANGFTMMYGGGVDAKVSSRFAVRVVEADWVYFRFSGQSVRGNARVATGIVFRF